MSQQIDRSIHRHRQLLRQIPVLMGLSCLTWIDAPPDPSAERGIGDKRKKEKKKKDLRNRLTDTIVLRTGASAQFHI